MKRYLTIDISKCSMHWSITSAELDVVQQGKCEISSITERSAIFKPIKEVADRFRDYVEGVALTMPGVIDSEKGYAYSGGIFEWIRNEPYAKEIENLTGMPAVIVNDAKAAALAEVGYGSLKRVRTGVMLMILTTGIGGAIVSHGEIVNGSHYAAGEFSYLSGDYKDREKGKDMFVYSCSLSGLCQIVEDATGRKNMNVMRILFGLSQKDPAIVGAVKIYCERLAFFIYNIQCVADADRFVLSGNITDEPVFMNLIQRAVDEKFASSRYQNIYKPEIKDCAFHDDARKYGAIYLFRKLKENGG